ncbi:MAG: phosphatase PAP2 family protein [Bacteroidetes bacterium]|nr:phosphatase PAP2 family protein [Bacteroidota bacterium]MDA1119647.1 phosphatase PAP2 family protein [Bacteroidota bacterium]
MIEPKIRFNVFVQLTFFSLLIGVIFIAFSQKGDAVILFNKLHNPFLDSFFKYYTFLGSGWVMVLAAGFFLFYQFRLSLLTVVIGLFQTIITGLFKMIIFSDAPRPLTWLKDQYPLDLVEGAVQLYYRSFPSGHSMTAFSLATLFALMTNNKLAQLTLFIYAFFIGVSRIYLSLHFLSDVVFGAVFGLIVTFLGIYLYYKLTLFQNYRLSGKL